MKEKKVLIWDFRIKLIDSGGPSGYLYNFFKIAGQNKCNSIYFASAFYSNLDCEENKVKRKWHNIIPLKIRNATRLTRLFHNTFPSKCISTFDLNSFDIIHFHSVIDLYNSRSLLKKYSGLIMLTTHSPEPLYCEMLKSSYNNPNSFFYKLLKHLILKKEIWAYNKANYIMFPTKYSVEPYYIDKKIKECLNLNYRKIVYCPTGIADYNEKHKQIDSLKKLRNLLPEDAFVLTYIGRHNEVKGYSSLKNIAKILFERYSDLYIIIAGPGGSIEPYEHNHWIELGWIGYANELIAFADAFILPNKETYFDLIALEVLRMGKPIIMSSTGGNKYFKDLIHHSNSILFYKYDDPTEAADKVEILYELKKEDSLTEIGINNRNLWEKHFTIDIFLDNYLKIISSLP